MKQNYFLYLIQFDFVFGIFCSSKFYWYYDSTTSPPPPLARAENGGGWINVINSLSLIFTWLTSFSMNVSNYQFIKTVTVTSRTHCFKLKISMCIRNPLYLLIIKVYACIIFLWLLSLSFVSKFYNNTIYSFFYFRILILHLNQNFFV